MDWLEDKTPFNDLQFEALLTSTRSISHDYSKNILLAKISSILIKQGKIEEALSCAQGISNDKVKNEALSNISSEMAKQGKHEE
jgi:hypothetical protein